MRPSHPAARRTITIAATMASILALAGCQGASPNSTTPSANVFGHVHGIGLNAADNSVYVASHNGVFRLVKGKAVLVANRQQDTMGFTIAGPDDFLASGHPAPGDDSPNPLGLIRSDDRAASWTSLSYSGEEDFHSIDAAGGKVYAYSSKGQLLASDDGRQWKAILTAPLIDIAVDPRAPTHIVTTTTSGEVIALTVGKKPKRLPSAPPLAFIDRTSTSDIVGVDPSGKVFVSDDEGATWTQRAGLGGAPEALGVRSGAWYAATEGRLLTSVDQGASWRPLTKGSS